MAAIAERIEALTARFEPALDGYLAGLEGGVANLNDGMAYALGTDIGDRAARGKRIRPALCLLTAEALGAPAERAMPFALAIELMHNFALAHDDIEDGDTMRRGREAAWVKYGLAHGINIGDYLLVHTMRALLKAEDTESGAALDDATRLRLIDLIVEALDHTHRGQALDMNARGRRDLSVEDYLEIVREKTGHYLAAPIRGGAIVAGADDATLTAIGEMAQYLGPLFQIVDDIIDLTDGKGREAVGSDIREGKRSFLVVWTAGRCGADERRQLYDVLDMPREATTPAMIGEVLGLFERHGAIEAGREYCRELREGALRGLEKLPEGLRAVLGEVVEMLIERKK